MLFCYSYVHKDFHIPKCRKHLFYNIMICVFAVGIFNITDIRDIVCLMP